MALKFNLARSCQGRQTEHKASIGMESTSFKRLSQSTWRSPCGCQKQAYITVALAAFFGLGEMANKGFSQYPTNAETGSLPYGSLNAETQSAIISQEPNSTPAFDQSRFSAAPTGVSTVPSGVVVGLPGVLSTANHSLIVEPSVNIASPSDVGFGDIAGQDWLIQRRPSVNLSGPDQPFVYYQEPLPAPRLNLNGTNNFETVTPQIQGEAEPIFSSIASELSYAGNLSGSRLGEGLGVERLPFGLFDIDSAQPANNFRIRTVFADRMNLPDRAAYFWAETGSPTGMPLGESFVDYQELRFRTELGSKKFSTAFEVPFRSSDPVLNENHAGLSDLQLATKVVMLSGQNWLLTQFTGFRFPTGNSKAGLGTGQVGMEPGLLLRSKFRETTWLHGEAKFWFPLGGTPGHPGQVVKLAAGMNTVWRETDRSALIPSLEMSTFTILDGRARDATQTARDIDGDFIFNVTPGIHYSVDQNGDFGLLDIGASMSFALSNSKFAESMFILESRWFW